MVPVAVVTDAARTVIGPDDPAAPVRVIVRVIIIGRPIEEVPVKVVPVMPEREPAVAKAATMENMTAAKPAAMEHRTATSEAAAMEYGATASEAAAVNSHAATTEAA